MSHVIRFGAVSALALAASLALGTAYADVSWAPTHTQAHPVGAATQAFAMPQGAPVQIAVSLHMRNQAEMDALTAAILAGKPAKHITSAEFLQRFAPTPQQVQAVVDHLTQAGFVNVDVARNRMLITADGSAGAVKTAFNTELRHVNVDGRDAHANVSDALVPAHLSGIVNAVHGLQTVDVAQTMMVRADNTAAEAGPVGIDPTEFGAIYNANGLPPASKATVGIISAGDISQTLVDLTDFVGRAGYPTPSVKKVVVGAPGTDTAGVIEWNLDSQSSLAAAGGSVKDMIFYVATSLADAPLAAAYNKVVSDNVAQAINVSLGLCEILAQQNGSIATQDAIFQIAVAQGQTFTVSSGDSGSRGCLRWGILKDRVGSYPAISPYVISVGGTTLRTSAPGVWASETAWSGGGGGPSKYESAPSWQVASGVLGTSTARGVPDVSFDADPNSGALIRFNGGTEQIGGTSLSAPLLAGFWARLQSANGNSLKFPAASLYRNGPTSPTWFHDVVSGSNGAFKAAAGWDYTTGFGTLDIGVIADFIASRPGE
jgi:pseudomonalisin